MRKFLFDKGEKGFHLRASSIIGPLCESQHVLLGPPGSFGVTVMTGAEQVPSREGSYYTSSPVISDFLSLSKIFNF